MATAPKEALISLFLRLRLAQGKKLFVSLLVCDFIDLRYVSALSTEERESSSTSALDAASSSPRMSPTTAVSSASLTMRLVGATYQDRMLLLAERRKLQTEMENKKQQLEDDRRELQHLKSKALRERWLLDSGPPSGPGQDQDQDQDQNQDQARTRSLEETIRRLEQELLSLEAEASHYREVAEVTEVKVQKSPQPTEVMKAPAEVKVRRSPRENEELKRALYSVQIRVERDRLTGETRVLSSSTTPPVDAHAHTHAVKVYEDRSRVVHEVDGLGGSAPLSSAQVDQLLLQADRVAMATPPEEEEGAGPPPEVGGASEETPVTMVFLGYQSVEEEEEEEEERGGAVRAELVLLEGEATPTAPEVTPTTPPLAPPTAAITPPPPALASTPTDATVATPTGNMATPASALAATPTPAAPPPATKKEKSPCRCCSIM
ncbi:paralemmin-1-like [Salarias fasciatus]|uniref:paralemmin-1-like n=1 Tax=Salarias fasciatus TaxID=181472 RepID=UPI001176FFE9|nr:paralemmin-1-like [Salarias fasciatus]